MIESMQWRQVATDVYQRPCTGQEHSASFNQNIADGHTELSVAVPFTITPAQSSSMTLDELNDRVTSAWSAVRITHPEIAIELSTGQEIPQMMTYRHLQSQSQIRKWLDETLVICSTQDDFEDVMKMTYNRRLTTAGKQSMMFFVPSANVANKPHCVIWNVSHAITDAFSIIAFINDFLQAIVNRSAEVQVLPEFKVQNLPASLIDEYETKFQPSTLDREESVQRARDQGSLYAQKLSQSVAMQPHSNFRNRDHRTNCLFQTIPKRQSDEIFAQLRSQKMSITFYAAAATILAVKDLFGKGDEQGALLGMTRNARRWIDTQGQAGGTAIPMATDVVFLWVPFAQDVSQQQRETQQVFQLAEQIRRELAPHLRSPHYMASMQVMCSEFVDNLKASLEQEQSRKGETSKEEDDVLPSPPGFSPQGKLSLGKTFSSATATIERITLYHTGRQVNASPWIGMFSLDGEIHVTIGFDEKYYDTVVIQAFFKRYTEYLLNMTATPTAVTPSPEESKDLQEIHSKL